MVAACHSRGRSSPSARYLASIAVGDRDRLLATPRVIFLFDLVRAPQPFFPDPLQRTRHQTVLGLDRIILAPRALGIDSEPARA